MFLLKTPLNLVAVLNLQALELSASSQTHNNSNIGDSLILAGLWNSLCQYIRRFCIEGITRRRIHGRGRAWKTFPISIMWCGHICGVVVKFGDIVKGKMEAMRFLFKIIWSTWRRLKSTWLPWVLAGTRGVNDSIFMETISGISVTDTSNFWRSRSMSLIFLAKNPTPPPSPNNQDLRYLEWTREWWQ